MTKRTVWLISYAILGLLALVCGLLVPAHLRAVDESVLAWAGRQTRFVVEEGLALVKQHEAGPAEMLLRAAQSEAIPGLDKLELAISSLTATNPNSRLWGTDDSRLERLFGNETGLAKPGMKPFT